MLQDIPFTVQQDVKSLLNTRGRTELIDFSFSGGGCINHGGRLKTTVGEFFLKWNSAKKFPAMFETEAKGLQLLRSADVIDIPEVVGFGDEGINQFLILTFVQQYPPSKEYWNNLGRQLALLHRMTNNSFGLDHDNYIGSLKQFNHQNVSWVNFFIEQRLSVQLKIAADSNLIDLASARKVEMLYSKLPSLLPEEKPSLLHGDLWSGNIIINKLGNPCFIDPAVYYGSREADLAMTRLFEVFNDEFYCSYDDCFPLLPGYSERVDIYNLYPLFVHLNLFGLVYLSRIIAIIKNHL